MTDIAGCILAFNRPKYLQQVVNSIEQSSNIDDINWYAFVDGVVNEFSGVPAGNPDTVKRTLEILEESALNFDITVNDWNNGVALQKNKAHQLFSSYETVLFFESDLIVGKHYIKLLRLALDTFPEHLILMNRHPSPERKDLHHLNECRIARLWGYGLRVQQYRKFKKRWEEYISYIGRIDYRKRNSVDKRIRDKFPYGSFSHDVVLTNLLRESGTKKLWPEISRGKYIGQKGNYAYTLPHFWKKRKMNEQPDKITFKKDEDRKNFVLR